MIKDYELTIGKRVFVHKIIRISERNEQFNEHGKVVFKNVRIFEKIGCGRIGYYIGYTFKYPGIIHRDGDGIAWFERTGKPFKVARIIFGEREKERYAFFEDLQLI